MSETTVATETESQRFAIRPNSLTQSILLMLSMAVIQRAVGFLRCILLCRWLPPEELGHWDLTLAFLDLAAPFAVLSIPSCFARYVEYYGHRGQLRMFLKRTCLAAFLLIGCSLTVLSSERAWFSQQLYGSTQGLPLIGLVLLALPPLIVFNLITDLFSSLRMYRAVSLLAFAQSFLFAGLTLSLAAFWHAGADSIIIGYGGTCLLCGLFPFYWLARMWSTLPEPAHVPGRLTFWGRLMPFIGSVWVINLLMSVFGMTDRYMLLHHSQMAATDAAVAVGQYHSARVLPLLIMQIAAMLGTMFVPYLSHDWEAGRRDVVCARLNMFLKVMGLGLTGVAAIVIIASPILFVGVFAGKFAGGEAVLPWALLCAVWFSMFCVAKTYFWCDEQVWLVGLGLVFSLGVNVGAGLVFLPSLGLLGAVLAASIAHLTLLLTVYVLGIWRGMQVSRGTLLISLAPAALGGGAWVAFGVLGILIVLSVATEWIFTFEEKQQFVAYVADHSDRLRSFYGRWRTAPNTLDA